MSKIIYGTSKKTGKEIVAGIELTEAEYRLHEEEYNGFCFGCGEIAYGETEPDARAYKCEYCDEKKVYGIPECLIMGRVRIV